MSLPEWADRKLLPALVVVLLTTDMFLGLTWLLSDPAAFSFVPAFERVLSVAPMSVWGAVLLITTSVTATAWAVIGRRWPTGVTLWAGGGGTWIGMSIMFGLGPVSQMPSSLTAFGFASALASLHVLSGAAVAYSPTDDQ